MHRILISTSEGQDITVGMRFSSPLCTLFIFYSHGEEIRTGSVQEVSQFLLFFIKSVPCTQERPAGSRTPFNFTLHMSRGNLCPHSYPTLVPLPCRPSLYPLRRCTGIQKALIDKCIPFYFPLLLRLPVRLPIVLPLPWPVPLPFPLQSHTPLTPLPLHRGKRKPSNSHY